MAFTYGHGSSFVTWRCLACFLVTCLLVGYGESFSNTTIRPRMKLSPNCSVAETCGNCTAYLNCVWCFAESFCSDKSLKKRGMCDDDDWDYGDCKKKDKEAVLLYVLLACAIILMMIVVFLVLYIFCCKAPHKSYALLTTRDGKKRKRTPLMSKKFKPVGSRTDELKKKYGFQ